MPFNKIAALWLLKAAIITATAVRSCTLDTAKFDDLSTPVLVPGLPALPQLQPQVGAYRELSYSFVVAQQGMTIDLSLLKALGLIPQDTNITIGPIKPASEKNAIGRGAIDLAGLGEGRLFPQGTISATGKTKHFDLDSIYFACILNSPLSQGAIPRPCTISASGFGWDEKTKQYVKKSTESLAYTPNALQRAEMLPYKFVGMQKMVNVTFGIASDVLLAPASVILFDDVTACKYYK